MTLSAIAFQNALLLSMQLWLLTTGNFLFSGIKSVLVHNQSSCLWYWIFADKDQKEKPKIVTSTKAVTMRVTSKNTSEGNDVKSEEKKRKRNCKVQ